MNGLNSLVTPMFEKEDTATENQYSMNAVQLVLEVIDELNELQDIDTILSTILTEARKLTHADAATIYLIENNNLIFNCVQNDTLFSRNESIIESYKKHIIPINLDSFVGYTALTGQSLMVDDVTNSPQYLTCSFNSSFDEQTGYTTRSLYTIPLKTQDSRVVGVLQLINAKDGAGNLVPFSKQARISIPLLANHAAIAITRGIFTRQIILRMVKMAELHDPAETGAHVQRVGAYVAEIYQNIAAKQGMEKEQIKYNMNVIRLAAMLHDVGKVGISDILLKKPDKLTGDEFEIIKKHTLYGYELFTNITSDIDRMSRQIALNHHERWDGSGYPSNMPEYHEYVPESNSGLKQEEIPLAARITAVADVFDALSSKRCYKKALPQEQVLAIIRKDAGSHFDPQVVEALFEVLEVINVIQDKYKDSAQVKAEYQYAMFFKTRSYVRDNLVGGEPEDVFDEIIEIFKEIDQEWKSPLLAQSFQYTVELFSSLKSGYSSPYSKYYNFNHTMAVALAFIRLAHGSILNGMKLTARVVELGLIAAFFHDTGQVLKEDESIPDSTPHFFQEIELRSIAFARDWMTAQKMHRQEMEDCVGMIRCTSLNCLPETLLFSSTEAQNTAYILGTTDILAEMADRMYLEKLPLLEKEIHGNRSYGTERERSIFQETEHFFNTVITERLFNQFNGVARNMRTHFRKYRKIDCDPYLESVTGQMQHINFLDIKCNGNYQAILKHLRRKQ